MEISRIINIVSVSNHNVHKTMCKLSNELNDYNEQAISRIQGPKSRCI